ncbi:MAG TPA: ABC transporter permease subunit [Acidobacteriota bacterium]|nr:ABC transporter permease subunit [Acidobacteriota bacterium]
MTILTIARNTFRENVRDKILYNLILFALIMILSSIALGQLTLGHENKVIIDLGLSAISIFGTLIAIFIGISLVYKELEKRTVYALLAKPVHRYQFILGKFLGLLCTLLVNVAIMTTGLILTVKYHGGLGAQAYLRLIPVVCLIFLSLALTTALALLFSTFSTPALSALFTLFLWIIGHFNGDLLEFSRMSKSPAARWLFRALYYVLPNMSNFTTMDSRNIIEGAAYGQAIDPAAVFWVTVYAVVYCGILLLISIAVFSRRDFK